MARAVTVSDGKLTIAGESRSYRQAPARLLRLEAEALKLVNGYASRGGALENLAQVQGTARLNQGWLGRAGFPERAQTVSLAIRALPDGGESRMLISLHFAGEGRDGAFTGEIFVPDMVYHELKNDLLAGRADVVSIAAATNLWAVETEHEPADGDALSWHLGPAADGHGSNPAKGLVQSLSWMPPRTGLVPEPAVNGVLAQSAPDEENVEFKKLRQLVVLNRWMMNLVIALIAIMFVIALK